ncbi:transmembrane protein, putative [Medicago truncatula]|uniref:Transmembrane protein, putative n=1 Tax=Medicago truncatula TaxID=3880 RepID=A0A072VGF8_MEDTR|nr:transmembrane protein, putative [Medicago truncatula]
MKFKIHDKTIKEATSPSEMQMPQNSSLLKTTSKTFASSIHWFILILTASTVVWWVYMGWDLCNFCLLTRGMLEMD